MPKDLLVPWYFFCVFSVVTPVIPLVLAELGNISLLTSGCCVRHCPPYLTMIPGHQGIDPDSPLKE